MDTEQENLEVLLVEDNENDAELAMMVMRENNLINQILWLKDGEEALDYLLGNGASLRPARNQLPKVVLLDIKMPKIDGLEVLRRLRANPQTKLLPIVILTSSREERDIMESYELCVNSYIVKPVEFESYTECIKDLGYYWTLHNQSPY